MNHLKKKPSWNQNIQKTHIILNSFLEREQKIINENLKFALEKISSLSKDIIFQNLLNIKKQTNDLITLINQQSKKSQNENKENNFDYTRILLDFVESLTKKIELRNLIDDFDDDDDGNVSCDNYRNNNNFGSTYDLKNLNLVNLLEKENSISFEYPIQRKRALSSTIEKRLNRSRKSSEEIERRIKERMDNAEKKKESIKKMTLENSNKYNEKIYEIKQKQKAERKEKLEKIYSKLEKMNNQQKKVLESKLQVVKHEHEKITEINYLNQLEKENKNMTIKKKLDISTQRRNKYLQDRINKLNNNTSIFEVMEKKKNIENRIEFLKKVFNENFIWELFEADYFDLDELSNLSSLTRFELEKSKLRKEKELIDKLYDQKFKKGKNTSNPITINPTNNTGGSSNINETLYEYDEFDYEEKYDDNNEDKHSRSFTYFNENDFLDIDYLFSNNKKKKNRKKKKKSKNNNYDLPKKHNDKVLTKEEEEDEEMRKRLIRKMNSYSQTDIRKLLHQKNENENENKMKKFLVKSESNGKYIQSRLIIIPEDLNVNNSNDKNNNNILSSPKKNQIYSKTNSKEIDSNNSNKNSSSNNTPSKLTDNNNNSNNKEINTKKNSSLNINSNNNQKEINKEKIFHGLIQATNLVNSNSNSTNTITINDNNIANILENNQITIRWCKICNMILPNDQDPNIHINKAEHQKIKKEYSLSIQEESNVIMIFKSIPGNINDDLKNERVNAIKIRAKKLKQKMSLKAIKHENYFSYKQDFPSVNKQRIQKLAFDIEKQIYPNIKDYGTLENLLKVLIKILEQNIPNDLELFRQVKVIFVLVEVLKKPPSCHKSEIKSLGKIMELIIKILLHFSVLPENRNYMIATNRITVIADLLLWVLNKPTKIPLGISFLPDLIQIITTHVKHKIPFEIVSMKDDLLEYLILCNIIPKFKQKYYNLNGTIDFTSGSDSFSMVLLKSLSMFEAITKQININFLTKPVYIKQTKINENILYMFEYSELIGLVHLLYVLLLSNGPIKPKEKVNAQSKTVISASLVAVKILNNICRIDLNLVQNLFITPLNQEQIQHVIIYIVNYSLEYLEQSDEVKELLHETLLLVSYLCLQNENFQNVVNKGEITIIQHISNLPFSYFSEKLLKDILFPTLITMTYNNIRNTKILSSEINLEMIVMYFKEKIQLERIQEEDISEASSSIYDGGNNNNNNINNRKIREEFLQGKISELKPSKAYSTTSSSKSTHDMVSGLSDFVILSHRFPVELWEKAQEYYSTFDKKK